MAAGIYSLDFISGNIYIGKSIHIERRAQEHLTAFKAGKAAKKLQSEYDIYGPPIWVPKFECHPDHIDLMETYYIELLSPALNTAPTTRLKPEEREVLEKHVSYLQKSTAEHIIELIATQVKARNHEDELYRMQQKQKKKPIVEEVVEDASVLVKLREMYAKNRLEFMEVRDQLARATKELARLGIVL
jgi:predicted GIY-YIG superfamily endonuclease